MPCVILSRWALGSRQARSFACSRTLLKGSKSLTFSFEDRNAFLAKLPRTTLYPLIKCDSRSLRIKDFAQRFNHVVHTAVLPAGIPQLKIRGRITSIREAGKNLTFYDISEGEEKVQVVLNTKKLQRPLADKECLLRPLFRVGDSVSAVGVPWRTAAGELSLLSTEMLEMLAPCLLPLPDCQASKVLKKHNRVAELKAFSDSRLVLRARAIILRSLTEFFDCEDFVYVQTPIVSMQKGGASARNFETSLANGTKLYLRVAPELWLKRLVAGGMDRVYEIGSCFRNEGVDATHNPEFTTCEFYASFLTLDEMADITQRLFRYVAANLATKIPKFRQNCLQFMNADQRWATIDFTKEMERIVGSPLENATRHTLLQVCRSHGIPTQDSDDMAKLYDRLGGRFIEPRCTAPTFVCNHPALMAPLAKEGPDGCSRRFELYINGREYVNAYEEENDPDRQLEKLRKQNPLVPDASYVDNLKWGLPPTGGWGLGIDRLVMLLTDSERIGDVLSFGDVAQVQRL